MVSVWDGKGRNSSLLQETVFAWCFQQSRTVGVISGVHLKEPGTSFLCSLLLSFFPLSFFVSSFLAYLLPLSIISFFSSLSTSFFLDVFSSLTLPSAGFPNFLAFSSEIAYVFSGIFFCISIFFEGDLSNFESCSSPTWTVDCFISVSSFC